MTQHPVCFGPVLLVAFLAIVMIVLMTAMMTMSDVMTMLPEQGRGSGHFADWCGQRPHLSLYCPCHSYSTGSDDDDDDDDDDDCDCLDGRTKGECWTAS